jgi:hypothetical protein
LILFFSSLAASAGSIFFTSAEEALRFLELRFDSFVDVPAFLLALVLAFCTRAKEATIINQQSTIGNLQLRGNKSFEVQTTGCSLPAPSDSIFNLNC